MSQFDFGTINPNTKSGTQLASDLNDFRDALNSLHSGSSRPAYAAAGLLWLDITGTPWILRLFDGTDDITVGTFNASTNVFAAAGVLASSTDNAVPKFNGTTGAIQDSGVIVDDNNGIRVPGNLKLSKGTDIASGTAITIPADGNFFDVTGTTTIATIGTVAVGTQITLQFDGALTLTHSTDLVLPGGVNITTAAGDVATFVEYASGDWICIAYSNVFAFSGTSANDLVRLDGSARLPAVDGSQLTNVASTDFADQAEMEAATATDEAVTPGRQHYHPGHPKAWITFNGTGTVAINADYGVASITDNGTGDYTVTFDTAFSSANYVCVANADRTVGATNATETMQVVSQAAGAFRMLWVNSVPGAADQELVMATFLGDQ